MGMRSKAVSTQIQERQWKQTPKESDYRYFKRLLQDFYITLEIPLFNTYKDLYTWVHEQINNSR